MKNKAKICFSNGTHIIVDEDQLLVPIVKVEINGKMSTSTSEPHECWYHTHDGLIPSITELISNCEFFKRIDDDIVYKSSSVVSIENL